MTGLSHQNRAYFGTLSKVVKRFLGELLVLVAFFLIVVLAWIDGKNWNLFAAAAGATGVIGTLIIVFKGFRDFGEASGATVGQSAGAERELFAQQIFGIGGFMVVASATGCLVVAGLVYRGAVEIPDPADRVSPMQLVSRYQLQTMAFNHQEQEISTAQARRQLEAYRTILERKISGELAFDETGMASPDAAAPHPTDADDGKPVANDLGDGDQGTVLSPPASDETSSLHGNEKASATNSAKDSATIDSDRPTDWAKDEMSRVMSASHEVSERLTRPTAYILVAWLMSVLGALFFITNRLWLKGFGQSGDTQEFQKERFWAGFFMRLGEAQIFTLVMILVLATGSGSFSVSGEGTQSIVFSYKWLPLVGLMLGMFVKSGERIVFGLANRLFAAMEAFLPSRAETPRLNDGKPKAKPTDRPNADTSGSPSTDE
jgi:hypothetical protein